MKNKLVVVVIYLLLSIELISDIQVISRQTSIDIDKQIKKLNKSILKSQYNLPREYQKLNHELNRLEELLIRIKQANEKHIKMAQVCSNTSLEGNLTNKLCKDYIALNLDIEINKKKILIENSIQKIEKNLDDTKLDLKSLDQMKIMLELLYQTQTLIGK